MHTYVYVRSKAINNMIFQVFNATSTIYDFIMHTQLETTTITFVFMYYIFVFELVIEIIILIIIISNSEVDIA